MIKRIGFTLIELIVVILILGILAAVAVPRFINLKSQANVAALMGLRAAIYSAADLAHALQLTAGVATYGTITMEGVQVWVNNGYPEGTASGINSAVRYDSSMFTTIFAGGPSTIFQVTGAPDSTHCQITYVRATPTAPPVITTLADGC